MSNQKETMVIRGGRVLDPASGLDDIRDLSGCERILESSRA